MAKGEFDQIVGEMSVVMGKLWHWPFGEYAAGDSWSPAVNVYRLDHRLEVCVDLAGIDKRSIEVRVEPGRLVVRGFRAAPEPRDLPAGQAMRIVCMEIDHGSFCRTIPLPDQVDLTRVESHYDLGWLWIRLPMREPG